MKIIDEQDEEFTASLQENGLSEKNYAKLLYSTFSYKSITYHITGICKWPVNGIIKFFAKPKQL